MTNAISHPATTRRPAKKQINMRVSDLTARQLEELMAVWHTSQTETLTVIIDRAHREEVEKRNR